MRNNMTSGLNRGRTDELPEVYHRRQDNSKVFSEIPETHEVVSWDGATGTVKKERFTRMVKSFNTDIRETTEIVNGKLQFKECGVSNWEHVSALVTKLNYKHRKDAHQQSIKWSMDNFNESLKHYNVCFVCWKPLRTTSISVLRSKHPDLMEALKDLAEMRNSLTVKTQKRSIAGATRVGVEFNPSRLAVTNTVGICKPHFRLARKPDGRWFYFLYTGRDKNPIGRRITQRTAPTGRTYPHIEYYDMVTQEVVIPPTEYLELDVKCTCKNVHKR